MAGNSIVAATGLEPFQLLFQSLTWVFLLLTVLVVAGTAFVALIRFGIPFAVERLSAPFAPNGGTIPAVPSRPAAPLTRPGVPNGENLAAKLRSIDWFQFEKLM